MAVFPRIFALAAALALLAGSAHAETYPSRVVKVIVPYPPGATTDFMGRLFADYLRSKSSYPVIVENIAGASATIGMAAAVNSAADGHTLLIGGSAITSAALLFKLPFEPAKDLVPVGTIGRIPTVFAIHKDVQAATLGDFVRLARSEPGKFNFVSPGSGTPPHIAPLELAGHYGLELVHVPYRGIAPAIADLIAGRGHLIGVDVSPILQHIQNGTLRALAVASDRRLAVLPEVPTASEAGFAEYRHYAWWGVFAPRGTPSEVLDALNRILKDAVADPAVRQRLLAYHVESLSLSRDQMENLLKDEYAKMSDVVKRYGIKPE